MSGITCLSYYMLNVTVIVPLDHCVNELCNYVRIDSSRDIDSEDNNNNGHCIVSMRVCKYTRYTYVVTDCKKCLGLR